MENIEAIRRESPLIHNISNYVANTVTANALLALGASPVMAHAIDEVEEMCSNSKALVINIGTLDYKWVVSMQRAGAIARAKKIPIILDPVGAGATKYRTYTALNLLNEVTPSIIRGNASEILALAGRPIKSKGVESRHKPEEAIEAAHELSTKYGLVVSISGSTDLVIKNNKMCSIANGHPTMSKIVGFGCISAAIVGACVAVSKSHFDATIHAMAIMGITGEKAGKKTSLPGFFQMHFINALHTLKLSDFTNNIKIHETRL